MKDRFEKGVRVIYVPTHADGDFTHPDCEYGVVSSKNYKYVFVKFDPKHLRVQYITGDEDVTAQACDPNDLITVAEANFIQGV